MMLVQGQNRAKCLRVLKQYYLATNVQKFRDAFFIWKRFTVNMRIVEYHENKAGPICIQNWLLRLRFNALAQMMQYDGHEDELILRVVAFTQRRYENLAEKVVTRLMVCPKNSLLPRCFDRIVNYTRVMKKWKATGLWYNNRRQKPVLYRAFRLWKS